MNWMRKKSILKFLYLKISDSTDNGQTGFFLGFITTPCGGGGATK